MACSKCADGGWVCENHPDRPFEAVCVADNACTCGGAGMPCICNPMSKDVAQVLPFKRKRLLGFIPDGKPLPCYREGMDVVSIDTSPCEMPPGSSA